MLVLYSVEAELTEQSMISHIASFRPCLYWALV
jgi:hypothetical protein